VATEDPNMSSENSYIGLSPLTLDDVRNFCNTYIKPFAPYQEEKVYDTIINNLAEYYYNQLYFNVPIELKQLYEEANFDSTAIYDQLLIAIGVPSAIITSISLPNKLIFLKTLSDFERYKGTISFFQNVAEAFSDRLSIYELFIDWDNIHSEWIFKPVKVYLHDDMELNIDPISYATVQASIPSLLLSEEQLTTLREDEKLILPIKSNIILLDNDLMTDVSLLYDVIVAIFLHTYRDNYIDLYFQDDSKIVQLKTVYFLWFYLLTEYYNIPWTAFSSKVLLRFVYGEIGFPAFIGTTPTTIDNLSTIIDRYDNIKIVNTTVRDYDDSQSLRDSLYQDISKAFYTVADSSATTAEEMYNELIIMNSALITYIDERISNTVIGEKAEINLILTEIYSSLLLYSSSYSADSYFAEYVDYFLRYLPQVLVNPENTTSYTLLYNLKPYHVELLSTYNTGIRCRDKFNQVFIDDETESNFLYSVIFAGVLSFSDDYVSALEISKESGVSLLSIAKFDMSMTSSDTETIDDETGLNFLYTLFSNGILNLSDDYVSDLEISKESEVAVLSISNFSIDIANTDDESSELSDEYSQDFRLTMASVLSLSIDSLFEFSKDLVSDVLCIDVYDVTKVP